MQRCPKCGHRRGADGPVMLWTAAFGILYFVFLVIPDHVLKSYRLAGLAAYVLFMTGSVWKGFRDKRDCSEYLKLNPPVTERVKDHFRSATSQ